MIKKLFDLLAVFGSHTVSAEEKLLQEALLPLTELDADLPAKAAAYVMHGTGSDVLLSLSQLDAANASTLLKHPGTLGWWYGGTITVDKALTKIVTQGINARHKLYAKGGAAFGADQLARLGKVLAAVCQDINIKIITTQVPSWMLYLLGDAFHTTFDEGRKLQFELREHWSVALLDKIMAENTDQPGEQLLFALFDRKEIDTYYSDRLDRLFRLPDLIDYLKTHQDFFRQTVVPSLSASGQICLIKYLGSNTVVRDFFADVIVQLATSPLKTVRAAAEPLLTSLPPDITRDCLKSILTTGQPKQRTQAADLLARQGANEDILREALKTETSKPVIKSIESALMRFEVSEQAGNAAPVEVPPVTLLDDTPLPENAGDLLVKNCEEMQESARQRAEAEIEENKTASYRSSWAQNYHKKISKINPEKCRVLISRLNSGQGSISDEEQQIIAYKKRLFNLPEFTLFHMIRQMTCNRDKLYRLGSWQFNNIPGNLTAGLDLRQLEDVLLRCGITTASRTVAALFLESYENGFQFFPDPEKVWPFFIQQPDFMAEALKLMPGLSENRYREFEVSQAISVLGAYPSLPAQFVPRIMELALGENKTHRVAAQKLLEFLPDIHVSAQEGLGSGKQEIRVTAVEWLARLRHPDSVPHLWALLKKEKREVVRAALLTALETLGEDISDYLSPKALLAEARTGLKAKPPASLSAWFEFDSLPVLQWADKKPVEADIICWWIILAVKLKMPSGNSLLQRYVSLLSEESRKKLAELILWRFIAQDTRGPTPEEAMDEARKSAPARLSQYQSWAKNYPEYYSQYASRTLEQITEEIKNEVLKRYLGSAISDKGMLALICGIEGHIAVSALRNYMRDHYQRRAQIEAMIDAVAANNDPLIIQLLLSLSRRYRTASVQEKARELVAGIAERNGWSADELADRTIPTAGLDETGTLVLEYGDRIFTAKMDAKQKLVLFNPEGKEIKALPAARKNDDEAQIKETKKQFSSAKSELKQVIELQSSRLYEAMCAQREWLTPDWQEYLAAHPVMHRLIEQLVWQELRDGKVINQFRPSDDGSLLNLDDDEITLSPDTTIRLAHAALMSDDDRKNWLAHFKDYKVKFLFSQLEHALPSPDMTQTSIEDRKGWLTDTFTLRGVLTKLGYQRGPAEDGGSFSHYYKHFSGLGLYVNINFSGSFVPEENIPAVLFDLAFEKNQQAYWDRDGLPLKDVPPILLAESYADYLKVAEACSGFDPEWEKKTPW